MTQQEIFLQTMENLRVSPIEQNTVDGQLIWKPSKKTSIHFFNGKCIGIAKDFSLLKPKRLDIKTIVSFATQNAEIKP